MYPKNWHFNSRFVLMTKNTPMIAVITEILWWTCWCNNWQSVFVVVKRPLYDQMSFNYFLTHVYRQGWKMTLTLTKRPILSSLLTLGNLKTRKRLSKNAYIWIIHESESAHKVTWRRTAKARVVTITLDSWVERWVTYSLSLKAIIVQSEQG